MRCEFARRRRESRRASMRVSRAVLLCAIRARNLASQMRESLTSNACTLGNHNMLCAGKGSTVHPPQISRGSQWELCEHALACFCFANAHSGASRGGGGFARVNSSFKMMRRSKIGGPDLAREIRRAPGGPHPPIFCKRICCAGAAPRPEQPLPNLRRYLFLRRIRTGCCPHPIACAN